ncbi:hypothetical protein GPECTOR_24g171 [Gonium pectorale]|uniref:Uncharacterized protein n=1 Tax=Gonium pectorale TaxID=33097 RepID=A0A150GGB9_GONPE|nr:hypothetical protein GPECTOR_24g171 [Gonium pectorale]|eukprot:KXZ48882.1 hypothetical protein GPECTOR_24g171 [Gonium pectorale]
MTIPFPLLPPPFFLPPLCTPPLHPPPVLCFPLVLFALNIFWYSKILHGVYKVLGFGKSKKAPAKQE